MGWWRWALVSPDGVAPSRTVDVSTSVNLPLRHEVQKFSSGTGSPRWSRKKGRKTVVVVVWCSILQLSHAACLLTGVLTLTVHSVDETKASILPELVELTNDEHGHVRLAGLDTVVNILSLLDTGQSLPVTVVQTVIVFTARMTCS